MTVQQTSKAMAVSLLALAGGVILFRSLRNRHLSALERDARVDAMSEQSFPASDAPAY